MVNISLPDETDDRGVHCVGAWPKGITVGNWREGGCAAHSLIQLIEIYGRKVVSMKRIDRNDHTFVCLLVHSV